MPLEVNGRQLETDPEGYLRVLEDWDREVAQAMAAEDGIVLEAGHWEVVDFLREYYAEYHVAPPVRILTKAIAKRLGKEKGNTRYLYQLFPKGPAKQACRYAGLPKPTGCI
ncbi:MAG: TusE/DsrC/DsvC family sulfur relay protein [Ectothiorhodospiraceae bacterium]|nr:TusE/DsrC/DsvC family sulfur relay protein [Chromatiales bacterium]MCP5157470.1 TusE/DsrC/DsvC family sulfur relay protein [Ectothiorhodospiraceae bacterium]